MDEAQPVKAFFALRGETGADRRRERLSALAGSDLLYADPHAPDAIGGLDEMSDFLAAFAANVPDATADVVDPADGHSGYRRATVRVSRQGRAFATGQYTVEIGGDGRLGRVIGFMGRGPE